MKKLLSVIVFALAPLMMSAQLKAPTETAVDTLVIMSCYYQDTQIPSSVDWPCKFFTESVSKICIAGNTYLKNAPTYKNLDEYAISWEGHINYYAYDNAIVNGNRAKIYKVLTRSDCKDYPTRKYGIDDYCFFVMDIDDLMEPDTKNFIRFLAFWDLSSRGDKLKLIDNLKSMVPDADYMSNDKIISYLDSLFIGVFEGLE